MHTGPGPRACCALAGLVTGRRVQVMMAEPRGEGGAGNAGRTLCGGDGLRGVWEPRGGGRY